MERQSQNKKTAVEQLTALTPFVSAYLIILGGVRIMIYYQFFNLSIFDFIDFSEILISIFDWSLLLGINFLLLYALLEYLLKYKIDPIPDSYREKFLKGSFRYKLHEFFVTDWIIALFYIALFSLMSLDVFINKRANPTFIIWLIILNIANIVFRFFERILQYKEELETKVASAFSKASILSLCGFNFLLVVQLTIKNAQAVKDYQRNSAISFIMADGSSFKSDKNNFYIGKTKEFIFVYHKMEKRTEVIKMSEVKIINFRYDE